MKKITHFFFKHKSFAGEMFFGLLIVSAIPSILAGTLLVNLVRTNLQNKYEKEAYEQVNEVSGELSQYFSDIESIVNGIMSETRIVDNIYAKDSWEKNKAYTSLYSLTKDYRNYAGFNVYDKDGNCVFTTESESGIESLPTYWGILKIAYTHPDTMVIRRAVLPHNTDVLLQTAKTIIYDEDCIGFVVVNIRATNLDALIDKVYNGTNGLAVIDSFYEECYKSGTFASGNLSEIVRNRTFNSEELKKKNDKDNFFVEKIGNTGLYLLLGKEPVLTEGITRTMWRVILMILVASTGLCIVTALIFSNHLSSPIKEMTDAMNEVRHGNLDTAINSSREDELGQLSNQFDSMTAELKNFMELQVKQQQEINASNIAMMQAQLNPHFLYNTLDTMKWVAKANQVPEIAKMSSDLAQILRMSISDRKYVTLREEIDLVEKYAEIQQIRFGGNFTFDVELPMELEDCIVPKLIVQPIVENAVIHGLKEQDKGHIFVNIYEEGSNLLIEVSDNGCGISDDVINKLNSHNRENFKGHIGFYNVDTIIKLYYGNDYGVKAKRLAEGGSLISIVLPVNKQGDNND